MTTTIALAPSPLRSWLAGGLLALLAFGACWTGAIVYWRARAGDPTTAELLFYLFVLPGALVAAGLVARTRLGTATPAAPRQPARAVQASAPAPAVLPLALLETAIRSPYGASVEEVADALAGNKARPTLDAVLVDADGFPLTTARCANADDPALQADIAAWSAANAPSAQFGDEAGRALVLATQVTAELAGKAGAALPDAPMLQLAPVLPRDWTAEQRDAAGRWLLHTAAQCGWPAGRIALVPPDAADVFTTVPVALLTQLATRVPEAPVAALVIACASHLGDATVHAWAPSDALFTSASPHGKVPGEGAAGLLLADPTQAASSAGALFALLEPVASARHATAADDQRGAIAPVLAGLADGVLTAAHVDAAAVALIAADTGARTSRMLELMGYAGSAAPQLGYAGSAAPQLDDAGDIIPFGRAAGACGAVPALSALALARHAACERNGPVLWLANDDPFQRCAAVVRPPSA